MNAVVMSAPAAQGSTGTIVLAVACSLVALFAIGALIVVLRRTSHAKTTVSAISWAVFATAVIGVAVVGGSLTWSPAAVADPEPPAGRITSEPNVSDGNTTLQLPTLPFDGGDALP